MSDTRSELRRLAQLAHERELKNALLSLFGRFDQWRRGELDPFELNDALRKHSQDTSRELQAKYGTPPPETAVAIAVLSGALREDELDEACTRVIAPQLQYLRDKARR